MKRQLTGFILAGIILVSGSTAFAQTGSEGVTKSIQRADWEMHWSKDAVQNLLLKDAIPFERDKFIPGMEIKRNEFAVMLQKALDIKINYFKAPDIKEYFDDVKQDAPYASAVIDLVTAGVFEGKGSFMPDGQMTREEMVNYLMLAYKFKMGDDFALIKIGAASFADADLISPEFSGAVARAQAYGFIAGSGNNKFNPKRATTRAEAASAINKLVMHFEKQEGVVTITPDAVKKDDSIEMKVKLTNKGKEPVVINHSSGQKFDFALLDADKNVLYRWSADKSFIAALTETTIEPGESVEFSDTLDGDTYKAIKDKIAYLTAFIAGSSDSIEIDSEGYELQFK